MTTVQQIDRLVISDDAVAARLWPRLGPHVRQAYTADRDAWVVLRRRVDAGETLSASTLAAQHKVFSGWAHAFRAASNRPKRAPSPRATHPAAAPARAVAAAPAAATTAVPPATAPVAATTLLSLSVVPKPKGGAGTAVAGGLLLAGLVAVAARRKRA